MNGIDFRVRAEAFGRHPPVRRGNKNGILRVILLLHAERTIGGDLEDVQFHMKLFEKMQGRTESDENVRKRT